jgi:ribosomal protein S1
MTLLKASSINYLFINPLKIILKMGKHKNTKERLLTAKDFEDVFSGFTSERERLAYMKKAYKNMSIAESFAKFYGIELNGTSNKEVNNVTTIECGQCYWGTVNSISKNGITFLIPGVKEELVSKENFSDCMDHVQNYLLNHDNKLRFEVREKKHGVYYVSVINGYYKLWVENVERMAKKFEPIDVHIDSLTKGGYLCHTVITTLKELTGKDFTSSVFIPGSNIVLNIERDFERWIGEDIQIIPQKIVKFKQTGDGVENSLIGSRKLLLQQIGNQNLYNIFNRAKLLALNANSSANKEVFDGTVTGIINSNKKTGIFVELNGLYITGLMPIDSSELLDFKPGDQIKVKVKEFEVQDGKEPFVLNKSNKVTFSNTRCVFELA